MYIYSENAQFGMAPFAWALHKVRILATDEQREPFDIYTLDRDGIHSDVMFLL